MIHIMGTMSEFKYSHSVFTLSSSSPYHIQVCVDSWGMRTQRWLCDPEGAPPLKLQWDEGSVLAGKQFVHYVCSAGDRLDLELLNPGQYRWTEDQTSQKQASPMFLHAFSVNTIQLVKS